MPRVAVPVTDFVPKQAVTVPAETNGDATNNHTVANDGRVVIFARNSGAVTRTPTVEFPDTHDGQAITPKSYPITAGVTKAIGPFPVHLYGTSLLLNVDHAEVKLLAYRWPT